MVRVRVEQAVLSVGLASIKKSVRATSCKQSDTRTLIKASIGRGEVG